jgi:hypothetical protein
MGQVPNVFKEVWDILILIQKNDHFQDAGCHLEESGLHLQRIRLYAGQEMGIKDTGYGQE